MKSGAFRAGWLLAGALLLIVALAPAALAAVSTGDGVWKWQNPLPQGNSINGAWFRDAQSGWLVGDHGTIIRTTDGGASWTGHTSGTILDLNAIHFPDDKHGWAVGGGFTANTKWPPLPPTIVATTDGGATWHGQPLWVDRETSLGLNFILNTDLYAVYFADALHGWAVGRTYHYKQFKYYGLLLGTVNGGKSWQRIGEDVIAGESLSDICFTDAQNGWIVGDQDLLATTDGGAHWTARSGSGHSIAFSDPSHGWIAGLDGMVSRTVDGGASWTTSSLPTWEDLIDVFAPDADHALALGGEGTLFGTGDGGATWTTQPVGDPTVVVSTMCFGDATTGWIMGTSYDPSNGKPVGCYVRETTDGGATWAPPPSFVTADLEDVSFVDRAHGWTAGADGTVMVTTDGGDHWTTQAAPVTADLNDIDFVDTSSGWAVGDGGTIIATADGGITWNQRPSPSGVDLDAVDFFDAQHGWAAGADSVLSTSDGGFTWTTSSVGSGEWTADIESVSFVDAQHGWVAGVLPAKMTLNGPRGCVYGTDDGGATWSREYVHQYLRMHSVWFSDLQHGWVTGDQKQIIRTTDGGATWDECTILTEWADQTSMNSIMLIDDRHGWAVGTDGYILATSDGEHWVEENSGTTRELRGVSFVDEGHGWVVGARGVILEDPGPLCRAPSKSVVRRGRMAALKCRVSDAAAVKVNVTIIIRNARGRRVMKLELRNRAPNRTLTATFRCRLPRGTYHFYVYASDSAGRKAAVPAVNKLIVR